MNELIVEEKLLTPNKFSRPQKPLRDVKGLTIHYVGNPGTNSQQNARYFENRKTGRFSYGSAHFFVDLDGGLLIVIPEKEMAYHAGARTYTSKAIQKLGIYPNNCTLSIEMTHPDWSGRPTPETRENTIKLCAYLLNKYNLSYQDLWLHHDITRKLCHKFYVENPREWKKFCYDVRDLMNSGYIPTARFISVPNDYRPY